eukprot:332329-Lingulodinium_polyedra.AAC.1
MLIAGTNRNTAHASTRDLRRRTSSRGAPHWGTNCDVDGRSACVVATFSLVAPAKSLSLPN